AGGTHSSYLLRPELVESIYYVHRATRDASWLLAARDVVRALHTRRRRRAYPAAGLHASPRARGAERARPPARSRR
ncbi:MAG: glycoside hydrolase family 47 protein, partial [bacterium]|nr:glycoside hydrolase family 47 protein [bacterium]